MLNVDKHRVVWVNFRARGTDREGHNFYEVGHVKNTFHKTIFGSLNWKPVL